jgi:hypothetical protein
MRNRDQLLKKLDFWPKGSIEILKCLDSGIYMTVWDELEMFGYGNTKENAINDLLDCLYEYNEILKKEERKSLGVVCIRDKEILNKFFNY